MNLGLIYIGAKKSMLNEEMFTREYCHIRTEHYQDKKMFALYNSVIDKIFNAITEGNFTITVDVSEVSEPFLMWLRDKDFTIYAEEPLSNGEYGFRCKNTNEWNLKITRRVKIGWY